MFTQKTFNKYMTEFFKSKDGEELIGTIFMKAFVQSVQRDIKIESGKENPGGPPVIKTEKVNILDFIAKYIPYVEGAVRGCQASSEQARNRSAEAKQIMENFGRAVLQSMGEKQSLQIIDITGSDNGGTT